MYRKIIQKIKENDTIIIHRHMRPDGDAIGSQLGLKEAILATFPKKKVYAVGDDLGRFSFMGKMDLVKDNEYKNALVFVLDSAERKLISDERYKDGKYIIKIDHHLFREQYGDLSIIDSDEISCASLIAQIIFKTGMKLTCKGAEALYTGLITDSGRFRFGGVNSDTFNIASKLCRYNFNINNIYNNLYQEDIEVVRLRANLTLKFKLTKNNVAYLMNTKEDIKEYNTSVFNISRGMVGVMGGIKGIDVWANFTEDEDGSVICEIRSNKLNINPIAVKYGGGGHKLASGTTVKNFEEAKNLLEELDKLVEENYE